MIVFLSSQYIYNYDTQLSKSKLANQKIPNIIQFEKMAGTINRSKRICFYAKYKKLYYNTINLF